jgi:hypothetical protein
LIKAAYMSKGGKGSSAGINFQGKDAPWFRVYADPSPGTIATLPRTMTHYVATEWGIVSLKGLSTWERAEKNDLHRPPGLSG